MATRVVEGKKPYTGGKAISIDENKVISLNLRDENNLIIYDAGDDEIYVDLQLDDEITPTSAFPIGVNVGRVIVDNGWDKPGTIISAETTSGDNIKIFYADEGTLWIDNGTGTFKQIYFKSDVDALLLALRNYIDGELAKKQNGVVSDTAPSNPSEGDLWYDTTNSAMKVWDGTAWQSVGTGGGGSDIEYVTQAEYNALLPGALTDNKHYFIYDTGASPRLPSAYQEVEYIESSGTQYINTGVKASNTISTELVMRPNISYTSEYCVFGDGWSTNALFLVEYQGNRSLNNGGNHIDDFLTIADAKATIITTPTGITVNGNSYSLTAGSIYSNNDIGLFGIGDGSNTSKRGYFKVYSFQISDNNVLVRDFVPCYRIADSVIGLYDLVNNVFYTNDGTGTFTKGPDVN